MKGPSDSVRTLSWKPTNYRPAFFVAYHRGIDRKEMTTIYCVVQILGGARIPMEYDRMRIFLFQQFQYRSLGTSGMESDKFRPPLQALQCKSERRQLNVARFLAVARKIQSKLPDK